MASTTDKTELQQFKNRHLNTIQLKCKINQQIINGLSK
jgi:hypothetical protein